MCKNTRIQRETIKRFLPKCDQLFAVYERLTEVRDLTTLIAVKNDSAKSYHVYRYGDTESERKVPRYRCESVRDIARAFDIDLRCSRIECVKA